MTAHVRCYIYCVITLFSR